MTKWRRRTRRMQAWAAVTALVLGVAACGGDAEEPAEGGGGGGSTEATGLAAVCPETVVVQLDWEPEAEHGMIYSLLGEGYTVDTDLKRAKGPLVAGGVDTGIDIEIRIGGSAVGFQDAQSLLYQDPDITFGFGRVGETMTTQADLPVTSVMTTMEKSPYSIYWDPETYPDVQTIADLKDENVTILVGAAGLNVWVNYFVAEGIWNEGQADFADSPKPASFIAAGGEVAEAGFATAEPYLYETLLADEWGKPVEVALIHDTGFQEYFQSLTVRASDVTEKAECFAQLVPIFQQGLVDYVANPDPVHAVIVDLVTQYDTGWLYDLGSAQFAYENMLALGILGNGSDGAVGSFDLARVASLQQIIADVTDFPVDDLTAEEMVTNQFIDPTISLP